MFIIVEGRNVDYVVLAEKTDALKLTYRIAEVAGKRHWNHVMNRKRENEHTVTVYLKEVGADDYVGMVTNRLMAGMDAEILFRDYRPRWNMRV